MKYENYDSATVLVKKIALMERDLSQLSIGSNEVTIDSESGRFTKIIMSPNCTHEYFPLATVLIEAIKQDLSSKIEKAKEELKLL